MGMSSQMKFFTQDVEKRLDNVYKSGAGKKYGYDSVTQQSATIGKFSTDKDSLSKYEDRMLDRI